jgi:hypothetical protein
MPYRLALTPYRRALLTGFVVLIIPALLLLLAMQPRSGITFFALSNSGYFFEILYLSLASLAAGLLFLTLYLLAPPDPASEWDSDDD